MRTRLASWRKQRSRTANFPLQSRWFWSRFYFAMALGLLAGSMAAAQQAGGSTELPGQPFFVKKTWVIGGAGDWGYLALDAKARQLFIAHSKSVQVVDLDTGKLAGEIGGFTQAYAIVLDEAGQLGYASDSQAGNVKVFDRRTFAIVSTIPTPVEPRDMAFEPQTGLLFTVGNLPVANPVRRGMTPPNPQERAGFPCGMANRYPFAPRPESLIAAIDMERRTVVATIQVCGVFGAIGTDDEGTVSVIQQSSRAIVQFDAHELQNLAGKPPANAERTLVVDWRPKQRGDPPSPLRPRRILIGGDCQEPRGLAVDGVHGRLFVGCGNKKLAVLNAGTGGLVTSLPIGAGVDSVSYDAARGLIYAASGAGAGSLTVIRRHVTDSYAVIQTLPTLPNARTMAIDRATGNVELVTALNGAKLGTPPFNGIGTLQIERVDATFQVLVVGN